MSPNDGVIAVFGDVHGHLDAMFSYCQQWGRIHERPVELVLQCGDLGLFPPDAVLDRATPKHAERDPTELGAREYVSGEKQATQLTVFVRGNHEDFAFLAHFSTGGFVDPHRRLYYLSPYRFFRGEVAGKRITIAGLGGIAPRSRKPAEGWRREQKYFADKECDALLRGRLGAVDILLTHEAPKRYGLLENVSIGSVEVTRIIERLQPRFAFYGHYGRPPEPFQIGRTLCVGMNYRGALCLPRRDGAMGIVDPVTWEFEWVYSLE